MVALAAAGRALRGRGVVYVVVMYWHDGVELSRGVRWSLALLRLAAFGSILFFFLGLEKRTEESEIKPVPGHRATRHEPEHGVAGRRRVDRPYVHGLAGDVAAERFGPEAMLAGDLLDCVPEAIRRVKVGSAENPPLGRGGDSALGPLGTACS